MCIRDRWKRVNGQISVGYYVPEVNTLVKVEGAQLDILVEAMGRMNFGKGIYDWKGITEKVEIQSNNGTFTF